MIWCCEERLGERGEGSKRQPERRERDGGGGEMHEYDYHGELPRLGNEEDETLHGRSYCMHYYRRVRD